MSDKDDDTRRLKHALGNEQQKKEALQGLLDRASDEIEDLVEADCDEKQKEHALKAAETFRRAANL
jgi:hypothetical protein